MHHHRSIWDQRKKVSVRDKGQWMNDRNMLSPTSSVNGISNDKFLFPYYYFFQIYLLDDDYFIFRSFIRLLYCNMYQQLGIVTELCNDKFPYYLLILQKNHIEDKNCSSYKFFNFNGVHQSQITHVKIFLHRL